MPFYAFRYRVYQYKDGDQRWQVRFPDVPEALTEGETENHAHDIAENALRIALREIAISGRSIPKPSPAIEGDYIAYIQR